MTDLMRRNPFSEMRGLQSQLNRLFEPFSNRFEGDEDLIRGTWVPAVDVCEVGDNIVVRAELPGMKEEDIDVQFENGVLTLRGERKFENETEKNNFYRIERSYGTFVRSFTLPRTVDPEAISAKYELGVLEITVPKKEEAKPRQIRIGIGKK